jgi:hypothetical protein
MIISLELKQEWATSRMLLGYLRLLASTLERICEMEADSPTDWYLKITKEGNEGNEEYKIELTHL